MKKYWIMVVLMVVMLSSCRRKPESVNESDTKKTVITPTESISQDPEVTSTESISQDPVEDEKNTETNICGINKEDELVIYNMENGEKIGNYQCEKEYFISGVVQFHDGFVLCLKNLGENMGDGSGVSIFHNSGSIDVKIVVIDHDGKVSLEDDLENVSEQDKTSLISFDSDGNQIIWPSIDHLCSYDLKKKEFKSLIQFQDTIPSTVKILDHDSYAFYGCVMGEDDTVSYGFINGDKMNAETIDYYHTERILNCGDYACITDGIDPMVGQYTSGKVIFLDGKTEKSRLIDVDTFESENSIVLEDGKYLMSFLQQDDGYRVRQYNIESMKVVRESKIETKGKIWGLYPANDKKGCYVVINTGNYEYAFEYVQCTEE